MKKYILVLTMLIALGSNAQFQELNIGVGDATYYGDLNSMNQRGFGDLFKEGISSKNMKLSFSLGYRYNFKERFSIGLNFYHMNLAGYDSDNANPVGFDANFYRKGRNLSFFTTVNQGFADFKIEPFRTATKWNEMKKWHLSPYVSGGIGFFKFNPKTLYNGQEVELQPLGTEGQGIAGYKAPYSLFEICIPVGIGVRFTEPRRRFSVSLDFNYNHTFTDYIDDVSGNYVDPAVISANNNASRAGLINALANRNTYGSGYEYITTSAQQRGNANNNDFFMTSQVKFSYYFKNSDKDAYYKCCGF
jgi:hypothetical protein